MAKMTKRPEFETLLQMLRARGFLIETKRGSARHATITRDGCTAALEASPRGTVAIAQTPALLLNGAIAKLIDCGYQKQLAADGIRRAATAGELHILQSFCTDLKFVLGEPQPWGESLGTICDSHHYDSPRRLKL
jgi:hypothetical protein